MLLHRLALSTALNFGSFFSREGIASTTSAKWLNVFKFRWQVGKLCRLWNDAIIGENHNTFPAVCVELLLCLFQFFGRRR